MNSVLNIVAYCRKTNRNERLYLLEQEFAAFAMYYFPEFFVFKIPAFQWLMYRALKAFAQGKFRFILWVMFRESAKTSIAKMFVVYCIVYRKKRFINWDAYDKGNAEAALFDVATWLQTNEDLISDFGQLFYEDPRIAAKQAKIKKVSEFVTANRVKIKAYSTQESTRGRIFDRFRPDLYILDDFETTKTTESAAITAKIIKHIDELKSGLSVDGQVMFLGNLIIEEGIVGGLLMEAAENPGVWSVQKVAVEEEGTIMWEDKYVETEAEAREINKTIPDRKQWKVSLEQKRKDLNAQGRKVYEAEMLNDPAAAGDIFFNREKIDAAIERAKRKKPVRDIGGMAVWEEYKPKAKYGIGADTSAGIGRDSCTSCVIRMKEMDTTPAMVAGTYANNTIAPDTFAYELRNQGDHFGECLLAPELNNTGYATVTQLKMIYPVHKIYRQVKKDELGKITTDKLGWEANSHNVTELYYQFRSAFEDGEIVIYCPRLLGEMRAFTKRDLDGESKKRSTAPVGLTRHFDLLRAACIAWEMRHHATVGKAARKPYKQGTADTVSEYHG